MNEADTRAELIDPKLKQAGWSVVEHSFIRREVICPGRILSGGKRGNSVDSDYVLVYHGKKLAVVEAKREGLSVTEGVRQAKDYLIRKNLPPRTENALRLNLKGISTKYLTSEESKIFTLFHSQKPF